MLPETAILQSPTRGGLDITICGLYVLERNIILLYRAGVKSIHLNLTHAEMEFYRKYIKKHLKKISLSVKEESLSSLKGIATLIISANCFVQAHYLSKPDHYFIQKKNAWKPKNTEEMFEIVSFADASRAEKLLLQTIKDNTPGFIARNINKAVSLPISKALSKTRVHPNVLTILNMIIGFSSGFFVALNSYWYIALGGFCFQMASVFDGVDGEVAKLTLKVSRLGGWLDTISDNGTLILFFIGSSYLFFIKSPTIVIPLAFIGLLFAGLFAMLAAMVSFLRKHTTSGSLVTYDKEFLQKLPDTDRLVAFVHRMKYYTKKEFFSLAFFAICLTGQIHLLIPFASCVLVTAAILLLVLNHRYRDFIIKQA